MTDTQQGYLCERCQGALETVWLQCGGRRLCWDCATPEERRVYFMELEHTVARCGAKRLQDQLPPRSGSD